MPVTLSTASNLLNIEQNEIYSFCDKKNMTIIPNQDSMLSDDILISLLSTYRPNQPELQQELRDYGTLCSLMSTSDEIDSAVVEDLDLVDHFIIGRYIKNGSDYYFDDLRNPLLVRIIDKDFPQRKLSIRANSLSSCDFKEGSYYKFKCIVANRNPLVFFIDTTCNPILLNEKEIIQLLEKQKTRDLSVRENTCLTLDMLTKQLTGNSPDIFIYELLQNANDYPKKRKSTDGSEILELVNVKFTLTDKHLFFEHTGSPFELQNIAALCACNAKEKEENKEAIGYKGIGFKTVFRGNNYVYLKSGNYSFCFDERLKTSKTHFPWQITPIWIDENRQSSDIANVFNKTSNEEYSVKFAFSPRDLSFLNDIEVENNYISLFKEVFQTERVILFVKNIQSVQVIISNEDTVLSCVKDTDKWLVSDITIKEDNISPDITNKINLVLEDNPALLSLEEQQKRQGLQSHGYDKIPPKYRDFRRTKVKFACLKSRNQILPVNDEKPHIYCYLPAEKANFGFPFLMNSDMIPVGDRKDIEDIELNHEIARIAGLQFFDWIKELLKSTLDKASVFTLIPHFETCKYQHGTYKDFIEDFQTSFEQQIHEVNFIPCIEDGQDCLANVNEVIYDSTHLLDAGILTDSQFVSFIGHTCKRLPVVELRNSSFFQSFQSTYHSPTNTISWTHIESMIDTEAFQTWLKVQENNDKFIAFLLREQQLSKLSNKKIFIGNDGELYSTDQICYDVDEYLIYLKAFEDKLKYLSITTRNLLKENEEWKQKAKNPFKPFDAKDFVDSILLSETNKKETVERLKNKDTSINFYSFLAKYVKYNIEYRSLPFFNDDNAVVDSFNDIHKFFSSDEGKALCSQKWISEFQIQFISSSYIPETITYLKNHFAVKEFSHQTIIDTFIKKEENRVIINTAINQDIDASKTFLDYCYKYPEELKTIKLTQIALKCLDYASDEQWIIPDNNVCFKENFKGKYADKTWLDSDWLATLDQAYYSEIAEEHIVAYKNFIADKFGILTLTDQIFYEKVIRKHLSEIFKNISGEQDTDHSKNKSFIDYLDENSEFIFEEKQDKSRYTGLTIVSFDGITEISISSTTYLYDSALEAITTYDWMPSELFTICHSSYGKSIAIQKIGGKIFDIQNFYKSIIAPNITTSINKHITEKGQSVTFHTYISSLTSKIATDDLKRMQFAKIYLQDNPQAVLKSAKHKILTKKFQDLLDLQLVEYSDLSIIDTEYNSSSSDKYWVEILENTKYTTTDFYNWIRLNKDKLNQRIKDKKKNIDFWRWVKNNQPNDYEVLEDLPLLYKTGDIDMATSTVYISDDYMNGTGIEAFVSNFDSKALVLSSQYLFEGDDKEKWITFWKKIGVKSDVFDVLVETIIPEINNLKK